MTIAGIIGFIILLLGAFVWLRPKTRPTLLKKPETKALPPLQSALNKTKQGLFSSWLSTQNDQLEGFLAKAEPALIGADVGVKTTLKLLDALKTQMSSQAFETAQAKELLKQNVLALFHAPKENNKENPRVILLVGVNGAGKTTTIGKLAAQFKQQGQSVLLAAGDTFRAAATEQLEVWAQRNDVPIVTGKPQSDPASVIFEAIQKAQKEGIETVLCDTAGRLHTHTGLMDELSKVVRVIAKAMPGAPHEVWLVLDSTIGQNGLIQAKQFQAAAPLTGVILTKLDGTAKGGVVVAISEELKLPVRYIGIGEKIEDLRPFSPLEFVEALFDTKPGEEHV